MPEPGDPQSLNRYTYAGNNPVRYTDPSGYDPLDAVWQAAFRAAHGGRAPTDRDRQDRLFSLIYPGSGPTETWNEEDWQRYSQDRNAYFLGKKRWDNDEQPSIFRFARHVSRLARWYTDDEQTQFIRGFALLFAGVPYTENFIKATWYVRHGPDDPADDPHGLFALGEGNKGWRPELVDDWNPSHHYAGFVLLGYYVGIPASSVVNIIRDPNNPPDIRLGNIGAVHGFALRDPKLRSSFAALIIHTLSIGSN